jgi:hypothetical protein
MQYTLHSTELFINVWDNLYLLHFLILLMCGITYIFFIFWYLAFHASPPFECYYAVIIKYKVLSFFSGKMAGWICIGPIEVFPRALWGGSFVRLKCFCCSSFHNTYLVSHLTLVKKKFLSTHFLFAGGISVGSWNDKDKGSRLEGQRGELIKMFTNTKLLFWIWSYYFHQLWVYPAWVLQWT